MQYHCLACSTTIKRSEVERYPDQPLNTEYRKHIGCPEARPEMGIGGTAIIVGAQNTHWTDGEEDVPLIEWLKK